MITRIVLGLGLALVLALGVPACTTSDFPSEKTAREALTIAKVETWREIYRANDADALDAFLANDFILISPDGTTQSKSDAVSDLRDNPWDMPEDFLYTVDGIIFPARDTAIVYGQGNSTRINSEGAPCHHSYTSSNGFKYINGQWRPVSSHPSGSSCKLID